MNSQIAITTLNFNFISHNLFCNSDFITHKCLISSGNSDIITHNCEFISHNSEKKIYFLSFFIFISFIHSFIPCQKPASITSTHFKGKIMLKDTCIGRSKYNVA